MDESHRVGFVSHIIHIAGGPAELVVEWDDDTIGIRYSRLEELALVKRCQSAVNEG